MKKITMILTAVLLVLTLASCKTSEETDDKSTSANTPPVEDAVEMAKSTVKNMIYSDVVEDRVEKNDDGSYTIYLTSMTSIKNNYKDEEDAVKAHKEQYDGKSEYRITVSYSQHREEWLISEFATE